MFTVSSVSPKLWLLELLIFIEYLWACELEAGYFNIHLIWIDRVNVPDSSRRLNEVNSVPSIDKCWHPCPMDICQSCWWGHLSHSVTWIVQESDFLFTFVMNGQSFNSPHQNTSTFYEWNSRNITPYHWLDVHERSHIHDCFFT